MASAGRRSTGAAISLALAADGVGGATTPATTASPDTGSASLVPHSLALSVAASQHSSPAVADGTSDPLALTAAEQAAIIDHVESAFTSGDVGTG